MAGVQRFVLVSLSNSVITNALVTGNWPAVMGRFQTHDTACRRRRHHPLSIIARMTRSSVLETLGQDYVRTARAKGLRE